jgi:acyl-CoA reductase-like NAD-dependent aldehyde dehydrogenase
VLSLDPVIGAIAAGNAVALKPSEAAPAMSSLLAELLPRFVDGTCIKVIEGGVKETTALLNQKWDKIFYTGQCQSPCQFLTTAVDEARNLLLACIQPTHVAMKNCRQ